MRRFATTLCLSGAFLFALGNAGSAQQVDSEELLGGHENPPVISDGTGEFTATLDIDSIRFQLTYVVGAGSAPDQAHLHIANPGNNGGIVVFLCSNLGNTPVGAQVRPCPPSPPGLVEGEILAADVLPVAEGQPPAAIPIIGAGDLAGLKLLMQQGAVYANVHTPAHATGEIRAQLLNPSLVPARRR
jgi:CHRD domain